MAVTNLFSLLDDDDSGDDLDALVARRAATVVSSTPAPKQSKSSQPKASEPKGPGHLERGRLPGSGRGRFFGTEGEQLHYRRFIDGQNPVSRPVKRVVEESEEASGQWSAVVRRNGGRPFYDSENWGRYYRDSESQWWYLDGEGRLWSEQGGAAIYGDRGRYYQEGDGRWWFMDSELCWWAEHGGPVVNFHTEEELMAAAAAYAKWKSEHGWDRSQKSYTVEELRVAAAVYREWKYEQFRDIIQKGSVKSQRGSVKSQGSFKSQRGSVKSQQGSVKSQQGSVKSNRKFETEHVNKSVGNRNVETEHQPNRTEGQKVDNEASSGEAKPEGEKKKKNKNKNKSKKTSDTASEKQVLPKEYFRKRKTLAEYEKEREEKRKALEAMKAEERRVDTKEYEGMQVVRKSKKQEEEVAEYIKPPRKPEENRGKAKAEKGKAKGDQKTPAPQVLSINEFLKDFMPSKDDVGEGNSSVRGQGDRLNYNFVQANSNGRGYNGGYSNGNGQDNRFQGRNSDRNGASYNGDRRGGNYSGTSYSGDRRGGNANSNGTGYNGGGYQAQGRYHVNNGGGYNGDRRSGANYDEEATRPATPVVRAAPPPPPPSVDDRAQFPALSRVPKA